VQQNEWDENVLEIFTLKQHLDMTRKELSQALYQHDAACRVIARLKEERDEALNMLTTLKEQGYVPPSQNGTTHAIDPPSTEMDTEDEPTESKSENVLDGSVIEKINEK